MPGASWSDPSLAFRGGALWWPSLSSSPSGKYMGGLLSLDSLGKPPVSRFLLMVVPVILHSTALLPGSMLAISAQLLPSTSWASHTMWSSSSVQQDFSTSGLRWLCQRSRHCLPGRPLRCLAISVHRFVTSSMVVLFGPWPFDEVWIQDPQPAVLALLVAAVSKVAGQELPVLPSRLLPQGPQLLVLLPGPSGLALAVSLLWHI